jgi:ubiquinone/menaquinone biosynthesis C-methylase UbiE
MIMHFQRHEVIRYEKKRYAGLDQRIVHSREISILSRIFRELPVRGSRVLDIPCGYGRFSILLLDQGIRLINADRSFHMVKRAREKLESDNSGSPKAVVADAVCGLPFVSGSFDLIFSMRFFHHIHNQQDRMAVLKEFSRVTSRWALLSYYQSNMLHHFQRKVRRIFRKSPTRIKMISKKKFYDSAKKSGFRVVKKFSLFRGLHSQHIVLLEKV